MLKEFSKVEWRCREEFGYNMLGFVFENSISKVVLDAPPNLVLKMIGLEEQLKAIRASVDHIQTNLAQVRVHGNMAAIKLLGKKAKKDGVEAID